MESLFLNPEVKHMKKTEIDDMLGARPSRNNIIEFMCSEHGFSEDRISKFADKLVSKAGESKQHSMHKWL